MSSAETSRDLGVAGPGGRPRPRRARLVAFYLPQFHPVAENDEWWGPGFTEWTNVVRSRPLFAGHRQPRVPADLGYYDLRVPEVRAAQAELAATYGIEAFCYWHYWFAGRRMLERPFEEVLAGQEPALPFCLAWANEPWSRTWLGKGEVLLPQEYSPDDDVEHARWLARAFVDDRYLRVDGRPVFLIYRPRDLPEPERVLELIRAESDRAGAGTPLLLGLNGWAKGFDFRRLGFDGTVDFQPQLGDLPRYGDDRFRLDKLRRNLRLGVRSGRLKIYDYDDAVARMGRRRGRLAFPVVPSVFVGWDNTPRRGENGVIVTGATPERFGAALGTAIDEVAGLPSDQRLVFVNAWNEWAEGNYLEPDLTWGHGFLEAVSGAVHDHAS